MADPRLQLDIRTFIPDEKIMRFHGDNRGYSLDREASSRIHYSARMSPMSGEKLNSEDWPGQTRGHVGFVGPEEKGYAITKSRLDSQPIANGTSYNIEFHGANPLVPGAPDSDIHASVNITKPLPAILKIEAEFKGDQFPGMEAVISDRAGQAIFLAGFLPTNPDGVLTDMPGDAQRPMGKVSLTLTVDEDGNFGRILSASYKGPTTSISNARDASTFTIDGWNKALMTAATPDGLPAPDLSSTKNRAPERRMAGTGVTKEQDAPAIQEQSKDKQRSGREANETGPSTKASERKSRIPSQDRNAPEPKSPFRDKPGPGMER